MKVVLTESQFSRLLIESDLKNSIKTKNLGGIIAALVKLLFYGSMTYSVMSNILERCGLTPKEQEYVKTEVAKEINTEKNTDSNVSDTTIFKQNIDDEIQTAKQTKKTAREMDNRPIKEIMNDDNLWVEKFDDVTVTLYHAVPAQTNSDFGTTANNFRLNLNAPESHRGIAIERTFMPSLGVKMGDVVKIEGTVGGKFDGVYQIFDKMNARFKGQHKIDILVPEYIKYGGTDPDHGVFAKIYVLKDKSYTDVFKSVMAPEVSKKDSKKMTDAKLKMLNKRR